MTGREFGVELVISAQKCKSANHSKQPKPKTLYNRNIL